MCIRDRHKQMRQWLGAEVEDFIWHLRWRGHEIIRQRVEKYGIACDLRHGHLHAAMKASHMGELQASYEEEMCIRDRFEREGERLQFQPAAVLAG